MVVRRRGRADPAGRQRVAVGYSMLEASDAEARSAEPAATAFRHRQPACRALVDANYGVGGLTAVAVWSELGDAVASPVPNRWSATPAWTSPSTPPTCDGPAAISPDKGRRCCAGRCSKPAMYATRTAAPTTPTTAGERTSRRQAGSDLGRPPVRPPLLPHPAQPRPRPHLQHPQLTIAGSDGRDRPRQHHGSPPRSAPANAVPAGAHAGRPSNTGPRSQPTGDTQSRLLSPTTRCSSSTQETQGAPTPSSTGP